MRRNKNAVITFRAKVQHVRNMDDSLAYAYVKVPVLECKHCDMSSFREHPKFGPYANSDLFPGVLRRIAQKLAPGGILRLDSLPDSVEVDTSGFLAAVTATIGEAGA